MQQLLVHGIDVHPPKYLGAPCLGQHVIGVGGVHGVAHAVLQRFAKAQAVDGARPVLIDLRGGSFPAGEAAFAEALDDLAQTGQNRIALEVSGAATLIQSRTQAYACRRGRGAVGPAGDAESGSELSSGCG